MRPGGQQRTATRQRRSASVDRAEGARVGACLRRVTSQLGAARGGIDQPDALDQLARRLPRVRGKHDLAGPRGAAPVGQALDEQAIPGEQRRGHRAAAHLDQVEPSASRHRRCPDGGQRAQDKEKGPSRAPLRRHRSAKGQAGRPLTRVFSGPPVVFHISSTESIMSSSSLAAAASIDLLHLGGLLGGLPERLVQAGVLLEVLRLEVVVPEDVQVVLDELGALLLDVDASGAEELVVAGIVLLDDAQARLGLDPGLLRVVDAARDVAVGVNVPRRAQQGAQGEHGISSRDEYRRMLCRHSGSNRCADQVARLASERSWFGQLPITMPPSTPSTWPVT